MLVSGVQCFRFAERERQMQYQRMRFPFTLTEHRKDLQALKKCFRSPKRGSLGMEKALAAQGIGVIPQPLYETRRTLCDVQKEVTLFSRNPFENGLHFGR